MDPSLIGILVLAFIVFVAVKAMMGKQPKADFQYRIVSPFLSPAERSFYGVLRSAVGDRYVVLAKVRVADIISPAKGQDRSKWQTAFNKISSKHFDYVLCDPKTLLVTRVIELNDGSHATATRSKRDEFLRNACRSAELPLSEFPAKKAYSTEEIWRELLWEPGDESVVPRFRTRLG